jgi:uncharacterized protein (TIGR02145 family)
MKRFLIASGFILGITLLFSACGNNSESESSSAATESANTNTTDNSTNESDNENALDGVTIGTQVWSSKNLDVSTFRNGDPIPQAKTNEEWEKAGQNKQPAWCYYDNDPANGTKYGKLYNWYAVNDPRGLAPSGWHVPSDAEWTTLTDYLSGESVAGEKMKSTSGWYINGNGTNSSGFTGLPGGFRDYYGIFTNLGSSGGWWSSSESTTNDAWKRFLHCNSSTVGRSYGSKAYGFSVRCLRD